MKKLSLKAVLNAVISAVIMFTIFITAISFLKIKPWAKTFFALIFAAAFAALVFLLTEKKSRKQSKIKSSRSNLQRGILYLSTLNKQETFLVTEKLLNALNIPYTAEKNCFILKNDLLYPLFYLEDLSFNDVKKIVDETVNNNKNVVIVSGGFTKIAIEHEKPLNAVFVKTESFVSALESFNLLPPLNAPVIKKENIFIRLFKKVNGVKFLFYGVCLILLSFIVFYPTYYLISGSVFTIFGLVALSLGKSQPKLKQECDFTKILLKNSP